jgi:predicted enzyme related to lactoylglutathione lyase
MTDAGYRGYFLWHELMTTDPTAAARFYGDVIGWGNAPFQGGAMPYTLFMNGDAPAAGMMPLPPDAVAGGARPHWLSYIGTPNVDATFTKAKALGATSCVEPQDIPEVGRFAVLTDPQGAMFAIYTPSRADEPLGEPGVGQASWHELATSELGSALRFYGELFGWEKGDTMDMGEAGTYQLFSRGGIPLGGMYNAPNPPAWIPYTRVGDVSAAAERIKTAGGTIVYGPTEVPGGDHIVMGTDPQGGMFALHERKSAG